MEEHGAAIADASELLDIYMTGCCVPTDKALINV